MSNIGTKNNPQSIGGRKHLLKKHNIFQQQSHLGSNMEQNNSINIPLLTNDNLNQIVYNQKQQQIKQAAQNLGKIQFNQHNGSVNYEESYKNYLNTHQNPQNHSVKTYITQQIQRDSSHNSSKVEQTSVANDSMRQQKISPLNQPKKSNTNIQISPDQMQNVSQNYEIFENSPKDKLIRISNYFGDMEKIKLMKSDIDQQSQFYLKKQNMNNNKAALPMQNNSGIQMLKSEFRKTGSDDPFSQDIYQLYQNTPTQNIFQNSGQSGAYSQNNTKNQSQLSSVNQTMVSSALDGPHNRSFNLDRKVILDSDQIRKIQNQSNKSSITPRKNQLIVQNQKQGSSEQKLSQQSIHQSRIQNIIHPSYQNGLTVINNQGRFRTTKSANRNIEDQQPYSQNSSINVEDLNYNFTRAQQLKENFRSSQDQQSVISESHRNVDKNQNKFQAINQFQSLEKNRQGSDLRNQNNGDLKIGQGQNRSGLLPRDKLIKNQMQDSSYRISNIIRVDLSVELKSNPNLSQNQDSSNKKFKSKRRGSNDLYGYDYAKRNISPIIQESQSSRNSSLEPTFKNNNQNSIANYNLQNHSIVSSNGRRYLKVIQNQDSPSQVQLKFNIRNKNKGKKIDEYSNEFINQNEKFRSFKQSLNEKEAINSGQEILQRPVSRAQTHRIENNNKDLQDTNNSHNTSQDHSLRQHSQIRIVKKQYAEQFQRQAQLKDENWLKKSADVLCQQRPILGMNKELEKTQFINFKEIQDELQQIDSINNSQEINSFTGFFKTIHNNTKVNNVISQEYSDQKDSQALQSKNLTFELLNEISDNDGSSILSFNKKINGDEYQHVQNDINKISFYKDHMLQFALQEQQKSSVHFQNNQNEDFSIQYLEEGNHQENDLYMNSNNNQTKDLRPKTSLSSRVVDNQMVAIKASKIQIHQEDSQKQNNINHKKQKLVIKNLKLALKLLKKDQQ